MDLLLIAVGAVLCAIGAGLGALIGRWGGSTQLRNFAAVVLIAGAIAVTNMAVRPWLLEWRAGESLRSVPGAAAIKEVDPDTYTELLAAMLESKDGQWTDKVEAILIRAVPQYIKSSTDEAINAYFYAHKMQLEEFADNDLDECNYRVGYRRTFGDMTGKVSPKAQQAASLAMDALIRATADDSATTEYDEDEAEYDLERIVDVIARNRTEQAFLEGTTNQPIVETCEAVIALIDQALEIHSHRSASLFRHIASRLPR